tara:strand:- start:2724 stop:3299 length:576 start_codon:yes stop_codon:yes gene_type:complete
MADKRKTKKNNFNDNNLVDSLLSKGKKTKISLNNFSAPEAKNRVSFSKVINTTDNKKKIYGNNYKNSNGKNQIINNFHKAISSTKSDDIILKMLDLKEKDIIIFYKNLESMIGKEMSSNIKKGMINQISNSKLNSKNVSLCPFCLDNKSNCVILLCGHLICYLCAKNINRCKFPCPKCKKPIKYIQFIADI